MAASPPYPSHYSKSSYLTCPLDSCLSNAACSSLLTSFLCFNFSSISLSPLIFQVSSSLVSTLSCISLTTLISALTSSSLLSVTTLVSIPPSVLLTSVLNLIGSSLLLNLSFSFSLASLLIASLLSFVFFSCFLFFMPSFFSCFFFFMPSLLHFPDFYRICPQKLHQRLFRIPKYHPSFCLHSHFYSFQQFTQPVPPINLRVSTSILNKFIYHFSCSFCPSCHRFLQPQYLPFLF